MIASERSLGQVLAELRSTAFSGDVHSVASNYREACSIAETIRNGKLIFAENWDDLLRFELEVQPIPAALQTVRQALRNDLGQKQILEPLEQFLSAHFSVFFGTRYLAEGIATGKRPVIDGTLIHYWSRLLFPNIGAIGSRNIWMAVASETVKQSASVGLTPILVPDYLVPLIDGGNPKLSFHTCGAAPGVTHFKPADLPGYAVIDTGGYSGWSTLAQAILSDLDLPSTVEAEDFHQRHWRDIVAGNVSKYPQPFDSESLPNRYAFVPLQIATDRTQHLARIPMLTMLDMVIDRFSGTDTNVVVKRHPKCRSAEVAARIESLRAEGKIVVSDDSIHTLISSATAVFTVNSGVGSEALVHLKPIYLFGEADYNCAAHRISSAEDLQRLTAQIAPALPERQMKQFLCYYRTRYLVDTKDKHRLRTTIAERVFNEHMPAIHAERA